MSERIALRCPHCQMVSYRSAGFVRAKAHFACNYCRELSKIDRQQVMRALAQHRLYGGAGVLTRASDAVK
jgi:hypothetical protein